MDLNPLNDKMTPQAQCALPDAQIAWALDHLMTLVVKAGTQPDSVRALKAVEDALAAPSQCAAPDERSFQCGDLRAEIMAIKWVEPEDIDETAIDDMELATHREGFEAFRKAAIALIAAQPAKAEAPVQVKLVDIVLHCPSCGLQHIDAPDDRTPNWKNEPHRSHLCHGCGHIWRPADVPTNGVSAVATKGKVDSPIHIPAPAIGEEAECPACKGSSVPGEIRGVRCLKCNGTCVVTAMGEELPPSVTLRAFQAADSKAWNIAIKHPFGTSWVRMSDQRDVKLAELLNSGRACMALRHDAHAPAALRAYADSCADSHLQLAADLRDEFGTNCTSEEALEILDQLIDSITKHGNYSQEVTLIMLGQLRQCVAAAFTAPSPEGQP
jgi:hypothetical protein